MGVYVIIVALYLLFNAIAALPLLDTSSLASIPDVTLNSAFDGITLVNGELIPNWHNATLAVPDEDSATNKQFLDLITAEDSESDLNQSSGDSFTGSSNVETEEQSSEHELGVDRCWSMEPCEVKTAENANMSLLETAAPLIADDAAVTFQYSETLSVRVETDVSHLAKTDFQDGMTNVTEIPKTDYQMESDAKLESTSFENGALVLVSDIKATEDNLDLEVGFTLQQLKENKTDGFEDTLETDSDGETEVFSKTGTDSITFINEDTKNSHVIVQSSPMSPNIEPDNSELTQAVPSVANPIKHGCPPPGMCVLWFIGEDTCATDNHCPEEKSCCKVRCFKSCV